MLCVFLLPLSIFLCLLFLRIVSAALQTFHFSLNSKLIPPTGTGYVDIEISIDLQIATAFGPYAVGECVPDQRHSFCCDNFQLLRLPNHDFMNICKTAEMEMTWHRNRIHALLVGFYCKTNVKITKSDRIVTGSHWTNSFRLSEKWEKMCLVFMYYFLWAVLRFTIEKWRCDFFNISEFQVLGSPKNSRKSTKISLIGSFFPIFQVFFLSLV